MRLSKEQWDAWVEHPVTVAVFEKLAAERDGLREEFNEFVWANVNRLDVPEIQRAAQLMESRVAAMNLLIDIKREDIDEESDGDQSPEIPGAGEADQA